MHNITTSQTIGPFSHEAWQWAAETDLAGLPTVTVTGRVLDGDGVPVTDAQIEAWQPIAADVEAGLYIPGFRRVPSDDAGKFQLQLSRDVTPPGEPLAYVTVFARGLVKHQFTCVFLPDDAALATSPLLEQVPSQRRGTLRASREADGGWQWDIHLQGPDETVFFDYA